MIPGEPQPLGVLYVRREQASRHGKAEVAGQRDGLVRDELCHHAILLIAVLDRVRHESRVDRDRLAGISLRMDVSEL